MLNNAYLIEKSGADTAENEQHSAEILRRSPAPRHPLPRRVRGPREEGRGHHEAQPRRVPPGDS